MYQIKILANNNFEDEILEYLKKNKKEELREFCINSVIDEDFTDEDKYSLISRTRFDIYGTTFQGGGNRGYVTRDQLPEAYSSHKVIGIKIKDSEIWAEVEFCDTPIGRGLKFASDIEYKLIPIYTADKKLNWFDIDANIKFIDGTESFHYTLK